MKKLKKFLATLLSTSMIFWNVQYAHADSVFIDFANFEFEVVEDQGEVMIYMTLLGDHPADMTGVRVESFDLTATAGVHYEAIDTNLLWPAGDNDPKAIPLRLINNPDGAPEEVTFELRSTPLLGLYPTNSSSAFVYIHDAADPEGTIQFSQPVYHAYEEDGHVRIEITRRNGFQGQIRGTLSARGGSAHRSFDYPENFANIYTFEDGDDVNTTAVLNFPICNDNVDRDCNDEPDEPNEWFTLELDTENHHTHLGHASTALVIIHEEGSSQNPYGRFQFTDPPIFDVDENEGFVTIRIERTEGTSGDYIGEVLIEPEGTTATGGSPNPDENDFDDNFDGRFFFDDGEGGIKTFDIPIFNNDNLPETGIETINLWMTLEQPNNTPVIGPRSTAVVNIHEDASPGTIRFKEATYSVNESDGEIDVTVVREFGSHGPVLVLLFIEEQTAQGPTSSDPDFDGPVNTQVFFGDTEEGERTITIPIFNNDQAPEPDETFRVTMAPDLPGVTIGTPSETIVTIHDDTDVGFVRFSSDQYSVDESEGTVDITLIREGGSQNALGGELTIIDASFGGTETADGFGDDPDFQGNADTSWTFADGFEGEQVVSIPIINNDLEVEQDETFRVLINFDVPAVGGPFGNPSEAIVTIRDDGGPLPGQGGDIQWSQSRYIFDETDGLTELGIERVNGNSGQLVVEYRTFDAGFDVPRANSATPEVDFELLEAEFSNNDYMGFITFESGEEGFKPIPIFIQDDGQNESLEVYGIQILEVDGNVESFDSSDKHFFISEEDPSFPGFMSFSTENYFVSENAGELAIIVNLENGNPNLQTEVGTRFDDGTALINRDYRGQNFTRVYWQPVHDMGPRVIFVDIEDNGTVNPEGNRYFDIVMTDTEEGLMGFPDQARVTIIDDEASSINTIQFTTTEDALADEANGRVTLDLIRTGSVFDRVEVDLITIDGDDNDNSMNASANQDYTPLSQTVQFDAGETFATVQIDITQDSEIENTEFFRVIMSNPRNLSQPSNLFVLGQPNIKKILIVDAPLPNDPPTIDSITASPTELRLPDNVISLDATVRDDGRILDPVTYSWTGFDESDGSELDAAGFSAQDQEDTTYTLPTVAGDYRFQLTVHDGQHFVNDSITITLLPQNNPPDVTISTFEDVTEIRLPINSIELWGNIQDDGLLQPFDFDWTPVGPNAAHIQFTREDTLNPTVTFSNGAGDYTVRLTARDGQFTETAEITITVLRANQEPTVEVTTPGGQLIFESDTVSFDGTVTDDGLLEAYTVLWTARDPNNTDIVLNNVTIFNPDQEDTLVQFPGPGDYTMRLTADDRQFTPFAEITITILPENLEPTIEIRNVDGTASIREPILDFDFDGFADDDGERQPLELTWTQRDPLDIDNATLDQVIFSNPNAEDTNARFPGVGNYIIRLSGFDGEHTIYDQVTIVVEPENLPPDVSISIPAGSELIRLPEDTVNLDGNVDDDGLIQAYTVQWTAYANDNPGVELPITVVEFGSTTSENTTVTFKQPGVFVLRLTAEDGLPADGGLSDFEEVTITVLPENHIPTVEIISVTPDVLNLPGQHTVNIEGNIQDDGAIQVITPEWKVLREFNMEEITSGIFGDVNALSTTYQFTEGGIFLMQLIGDDGQYRITDQRRVIVTPIPNFEPEVEAFATPSTITLPNNQVDLTSRIIDDGQTEPYTVRWTAHNSSDDSIAQSVSIDDELVESTFATFLFPGTFDLRLTVYDGEHEISDDVRVTVEPGTDNIPPFVSAQADTTEIRLPENRINLDGTVEDDGRNVPVTSRWTAHETETGPAIDDGRVNFNVATDVDTFVTFTTEGDYILRLTADDGQFQPYVDIPVTILPINFPPVVVEVIANPVELDLIVDDTVNISATFTDDDLIQPLSYEWKAFDFFFPDQEVFNVDFGDEFATDTTATFTDSGVYWLRIFADDGGHVVHGQVRVIVHPIPNDIPTVAPTANLTDIRFPVDTVNLSGNVTDDGRLDPLVFKWRAFDNDTDQAVTTVQFGDDEAENTSATFTVDGVFRLELEADDGLDKGFGSIVITVRPQNNPPTANPSTDDGQTIVSLPDAMVNLNGGVQDDGVLEPYTVHWTAHDPQDPDGPELTNVSFGNDQQENTTASFDDPGEYLLRITANDGDLDGVGEITITVLPENGEPTVSVQTLDGAPTTLVEPNLTINLDGTVGDDGERMPLELTWTQRDPDNTDIELDTVAIEFPDQEDTAVGFPPGHGTYTLRLSAFDGEHTIFDEITITVLPPNEEPDVSVATLGDTTTIELPENFVDLIGTADDDGEREPLLLTWTQRDRTNSDLILDQISFSNPSALNTRATFPQVPDTYLLRLSAFDGENIAHDEIEITVLAENTSPEVNVSSLLDEITLPEDSHEFTGTIQDDGEREPFTFSWTLHESANGPSIQEISTDNLSPVVVFPQAGVYFVRLTADDGQLDAFDQKQFTVHPQVNRIPRVEIAAVGGETTIIMPRNNIDLDGTVTDDGLNRPVELTWTQRNPDDVDGAPLDEVRFENPNGEDTNVEFPRAGEYTLRLEAFDGELTGKADIVITVIPQNTAPEVSVSVLEGVSEIRLPDDTLNLNGEVSDPDQLIEAYTVQWTAYDINDLNVELPDTIVEFIAPTTENTPVVFKQEGRYILRLTATDGEPEVGGLTGSAEVEILVRPENLVPVVNVTNVSPLALNLPGEDTITVSGTVQDDGEIQPVTHEWKVIREFNGEEMPDNFGDKNALNTTYRFNDGGVFLVRLTAFDGQYEIFDEQQVIVTPIPNFPPEIEASADQTTITLPTENRVNLFSVILDDEQLRPYDVTWTAHNTSDDSIAQSVTINEPTAENTFATFLLPGTYDLRITVDDGEFTPSENVRITVEPGPDNIPPYVFAEADRTETRLPDNRINLDGTAEDDGRNQPLDIRWTIFNTADGSPVPSATFDDPTSPDTFVLFTEPGLFTLRLSADDGQYNPHHDIVVAILPVNFPPTVDVQVDLVELDLTVGQDTVNLDGTVEDDGLIRAFDIQWTALDFFTDQEVTTVLFGNDQAEDTTATFSESGVYWLRLTADDGGPLSFDQKRVIVHPIPNEIPVVSPSADFTDIRFPDDMINLTGGASDDGRLDPLVFKWRAYDKETDQPVTSVVFGDEEAENTTATFSLVGEYRLELEADDGLDKGFGSLDVIVRPRNLPPTVNPSTENDITTITLPNNTVGLIGGAEDDDLLQPLDFTWTAHDPDTDAPLSSVNFGNHKQEDTTATFLAEGSYRLRLTVDDGEHERSGNVVITVNPLNLPPEVTVTANPDEIDLFFEDTVGLTSTVVDNDGPQAVPDLSWSVIREFNSELIETGEFGNATAPNTTYRFEEGGIFLMRLTAFDGSHSGFGDARVIVHPIPNFPPEVSITPDRTTLTLPNNDVVTMTTNILDDGQREPYSVLWTAHNANDDLITPTVEFNNPSLENVQATFSRVGEYKLRITVDDGEHVIMKDVTINVSPSVGNDPPTVSAFPNRNRITLPDNIVDIDAIVQDDGQVEPLQTLWTAEAITPIANPPGFTINNAGAIDTNVRFDEAGEFRFRLTADDGEHLIYDEFVITVEPSNTAPEVSVRANQTSIRFPVDFVEVTAEVTDDGKPGAYTVLWSAHNQDDGSISPFVSFANDQSEITTAQFDQPGIYILRATADDGELTGSGEIIVTVDPEIVDPGVIEFSAPVFSVNEDQGTIAISVERKNGSGGLATIQYETRDGSATNGRDYQPRSGSLNWANGEDGSRTIVIRINNNEESEGDRVFQLALFGATGANLGSQNLVTINIVDDDAAGIAINPGSRRTKTIFNPDVEDFEYYFTLQDTQAQHVTVKVYTFDGEEVKTIFDQPVTPGSEPKVEWNGTNTVGSIVASNAYLLRFIVNDRIISTLKFALYR